MDTRRPPPAYDTAVFTAAKGGHVAAVELLLKAGARVEWVFGDGDGYGQCTLKAGSAGRPCVSLLTVAAGLEMGEDVSCALVGAILAHAAATGAAWRMTP